MPSEDVTALVPEIDAAITAMNEEESTRGDLAVEDGAGNVSETGATPTEEEPGNVAEEVRETEEPGKGEDPAGGEGEEGAEVAEQPAPAHDEGTIERAIAAGIPYVDAQALPPASLERVIAAREYAYSDQPVSEEPKKEEKKEPEKDLFADLPGLDKETVEPEIVAQFEAMKDIIRNLSSDQRKELQDFQARSDSAQETINQASLRELETWFDGQVEGLGEDFKDVLGEGKFTQLDQRSEQFAKRNEIANQMAIMNAGYNAQGIQQPPREELFDTASRIVLGDKYAEVREEKVKSKLTKQSGQHIRRASGGKAKSELSDEEAIAAAIEEKFG